MDTLDLFRRMVLARAFEMAQAELWAQGRISGEMHLGTGEEAVAAVATALMREGDAVALDHRPTPILALLGVSLEAMLREALGDADGLCGGSGGHMHLFSREHLAASSGIVGAAGPAACGFALAAKRLRPERVALAFFGDGAANQGMLLESLNLASAWSLPVVFICKDNGWAITTRSSDVTGGKLVARAQSFNIDAETVDGTDLTALGKVLQRGFDRARHGKGPFFLHAEVPRLDGHFLGDPLVRMAESPTEEGDAFKKVLNAVFASGGAGVMGRAASLTKMGELLFRARGGGRDGRKDPLVRAERALERAHGSELERVRREAEAEVKRAVGAVSGWPEARS